MRCRAVLVVLMCLVASACGSTQPPTPSPPGSGTETITGRERLGWDQPAASAAELAAFRYAIYVDNVRSELADVSCASTAGPAGFSCSARLPAMSNGVHVLEVACFTDGSGVQESSRSPQLRVMVNGLAPGAATTLHNGDVITTTDGAQLQVDVLSEGLREPTALTVAPDGRVFVATADGILMLKNGEALGPPQLTDGRSLAIGLSPDFNRDGYLFVTQAVPMRDGVTGFRTSRVRDMGGWFADRMVILEHGPAAATPSAALAFGPDAKLHLAFDDGGSAAAAERMSEWRGKLLRMEPDGRTPSDQAAASPVVWRALTSPRGFDWGPDGTSLWLADASREGVERLRVIVSSRTQPRRASQAASYALPEGIGASAVAFYRAHEIPAFAGNLFVAGANGRYILRLRLDDQGRPTSTGRLLDGIAAIRGLTVGADGAIYFVTESALVRLRPLAQQAGN